VQVSEPGRALTRPWWHKAAACAKGGRALAARPLSGSRSAWPSRRWWRRGCQLRLPVAALAAPAVNSHPEAASAASSAAPRTASLDGAAGCDGGAAGSGRCT